ncbi:MAG: SEL1-like repeat protein [Alphaproteobacteria bacterium]|nr:SEL1-like repeat protein [Alphaproteobacteria bacterium]
MGRFWILAGAAVAVVLAAVVPKTAWAQAEKRVALVIGNATYKEAPLKNPVNDARAMAARLRQLNFDVIARENATRQEMASAVAEFAHKLGPDSAAVIYYAGHGIQARGRNFLIPIDATLESETDLRFQAVDIGSLTDELEQAQSRVSFVILDACRNNPFERRMRGGPRGLAAVDAARGSLIAYATAPGSVAADGAGDNGVYTAALLKALNEPGLKAEEVFKRVRIEVTQETKNQQTPWESSSLTGDFVFNITVNVAPTVVAPAASVPAAPSDREALFWQSAQSSNRAEEYEEYLKQFPQGMFAGLARSRIAAAQQAAQLAAKPQQQAALPPPQEAAAKGPAVEERDAMFVAVRTATLREGPDAGAKSVGTLAVDETVAVTGKVKDKNWLRVAQAGRTAYVFGDTLKEIDPSELRAWTALKKDDKAGLEEFAKAYPKGHFAGRARQQLAMLGAPKAAAPGASGSQPPVHQCDRLAANPYIYPLPGVKGVPLETLDPSSAVQACEAALRQSPDEPRFAYQLARALTKDKQYAKAIALFRGAVERGHLGGTTSIALMYMRGEGVPKDEAEAVRLFRQAADKNFAPGQYGVGLAYYNGFGVAKDETEAVKWFRLAARQSYPPAMNMLGLAYMNGRGVAKDEPEAVKLFRPAAEQGLASAELNLGRAYGAGRGVAKDEAEALKWIRRSAEQNNSGGQWSLGRGYRYGLGGLARDDAEAVRWFRAAVAQGLGAAEYDLAEMHAGGLGGLAKDDAEAVRLTRSAADKNVPIAQSAMGTRHTNGNGVAQDNIEAQKWLMLAQRSYGPGDQFERVKKAAQDLAAKMTPAQMTEATRRADQWKSKAVITF